MSNMAKCDLVPNRNSCLGAWSQANKAPQSMATRLLHAQHAAVQSISVAVVFVVVVVAVTALRFTA